MTMTYARENPRDLNRAQQFTKNPEGLDFQRTLEACNEANF